MFENQWTREKCYGDLHGNVEKCDFIFVCMMHERVVCATYTKFVMQTWVYVDYFYVALWNLLVRYLGLFSHHLQVTNAWNCFSYA